VMNPRVFTITLLSVFTIGCTDSLKAAWPDYKKESVPDAPVSCQNHRKQSYAKTCYFLPENLAMTKVFGMAPCFPVTLQKVLAYICECANARIYSTNWGSAGKDLAERPLKLTPKNEKNLKKTPGMGKMSAGLSSFSKIFQSYTYWGSKRKTASSYIGLSSRKSWLLWSSESENRSIINSAVFNFQCRKLQTISLLFTQPNPWEYPYDFRQCAIAPRQRFKAFFHRASATISKSFFTALFTGTQSYRKSLENHPAQGNTQSLFSKYKRSQCRYLKSVCSMGAT
ncbi:MAG TPA: hypothetical protein VLH40_00470, partial [Atribacteraceae bacterium]|nr:hypothetical protein [Atribacteraceae bacterium]